MKVPTYQSQVGLPAAGNPLRVDPRALGSTGAGLASAGEALSDAERIVSRSEEFVAAAEAAKVTSQARIDWIQRAGQMRDQAPLGADGFVQQITEAFDKDAADRINAARPAARRYLEQRLTGLRERVLADAIEFTATSRTVKQLSDLNETLTFEANAVRLDDEAFAGAVANGTAAILASQIPATEKEKHVRAFERRLAVAVMEGAIERAPADARARLQAGEFQGVLSPEDLDRLLAQADRQEKNNAVQARLDAEEQRRALAQQQDQTRDQLFKQFIDGGLTMDQVKAANLKPEVREHLWGLLERQAAAGNATTSTPSTFIRLFRRVHSAGADRITSADQLLPFVGQPGDNLSPADFEALRADIGQLNQQAQAPHAQLEKDFLRAAEDRIAKPNTFGVRDPGGAEQYYLFLNAYRQARDEKIKAGVSPMALLDPESPEYLGKMVPRFQRSLTDILSGEAAAARGAAPAPAPDPDAARRPGEAPEDYLKRRGLQ